MRADALDEQTQASHQGFRLNRRTQDALTIILFLLPSFTFFFVFQIYPIFQSLYDSLFNWKGFGAPVDLIGLQNYQRILADPVFMKALKNGLLIVVLSVTLQLPFSLGLALLVRRKLPGRIFFRTLFFLPYVFSEVITGIIWASMFKPDPQFGLINAIITRIPGVEAHPFLGDPQTVMVWIFIALTWKWFGFHMLLYMAGLTAIPHELEEAAIIAGATGRQILTKVTIPLLGPTIRTSIYLSVVGSLQQFGLVWVMSQGGPVNASETMATYMYRFGFIRLQLGYGSAVAVVMLALCLVFSVIYRRFTRQPDYLGGISI